MSCRCLSVIAVALAMIGPAGAAGSASPTAEDPADSFHAASGTIGCRAYAEAQPLILVCTGAGVSVSFAAGREGRWRGYGPPCRTLSGGWVAWCPSGDTPRWPQARGLGPGQVWRHLGDDGRVRLRCRSGVRALRCRNEAGRLMVMRVNPRTVRAA